MNPPPYVAPTEQLVMEVFVSDLERSLAFYEELGFDFVERHGTFATLAWEGVHLFLYQPPDVDPPEQPEPPTTERTRPDRSNLQIMVPDVDALWERVQEIGADVIVPIGDRSYGCRDFTIADPDGFGLLFASHL